MKRGVYGGRWPVHNVGMENMIFTQVRAGTLEEEVFNWARYACKDHFEADLEWSHEKVEKMFKKDSQGWHIIKDEDVIDDMIYRLEEQLPAMQDSAVDIIKARKDLQAGKRVANKLKEIKGDL